MSTPDTNPDGILSPGSTATGSGTSMGEDKVEEQTPESDPSVS